MSDVIWALVSLCILWRLDKAYMETMAAKIPLRDAQYQELKAQIKDLQVQVSQLALERALKDDE